MKVRITTHAHPRITELYGGVSFVRSDGETLRLHVPGQRPADACQYDYRLADIALIQLDHDGDIK